MDKYTWLKNNGLANELHSFDEVVDKPLVKLVKTHCSSNTCQGRKTSRHGKVVHVGLKGLECCPECNSGARLFYSSELTREGEQK